MKYSKIFAIASLVGSIFAGESFAKHDDRWYVAPSVSYLWLDDDRDTSRSGHGLNLGFGKAVSEKVNLEVRGLYNRYQHQDDLSTRGRNRRQWDTFGVTFDAFYFIDKGEKFAPYVVGGVGAMDSNLDGKNIVGFIGEAGVGTLYKWNESFSLRGDVRYRYNDNFEKQATNNDHDRYNDMVVNLGVLIPFGKKAGHSYVEKKAVAPVVAAPVAAKFVDSDGDGVEDSKDQCKNTKKGAKVNKYGCAIGVTLKGVRFKGGSDELLPEAVVALNRIADSIKATSGDRAIEVQGHTSTDGGWKFNQNLSQKRAQAVVDYLRDQGVENEMTAKGYGEQQPIYDDSTAIGRWKNRRVELLWK